MAAQSVLTSQTIADRFGLHTTDLECLDLIDLRGQATPGELAKATGVTSRTMTAVFDRLERAGYVRAADPGDRRRHLIRIQPGAIEPIKATYEPHASGHVQAVVRLRCSRSSSDRGVSVPQHGFCGCVHTGRASPRAAVIGQASCAAHERANSQSKARAAKAK